MGRTVCTEPQCLYKNALYLFLGIIQTYLSSLGHTGGGMGGRAAGLQPPKAKLKKKHRFFLDTMISNVLRDLHYSLNQLLKSSDDWPITILENINTFRICRFFLFQLVLIFLVTLTRCRLGDFDMIS